MCDRLRLSPGTGGLICVNDLVVMSVLLNLKLNSVKDFFIIFERLLGFREGSINGATRNGAFE